MSNDLQGVTSGRAPAAAGPAETDADAPCEIGVTAGSPAGHASGLDPLEMRAWIAFLRAHARVTRQLEADLLASGDPPLAEYDVLVQLAQSEGSMLRMHELADRIVLSRAGITRLVDRLVADGLVERARCGADARGSFAVLTPAGLERLRSARPGHLASVKRHFLESFSATELETLAELLERRAVD